ncbi:MAG: response regulator, partial [Planctomycetaceae bacterium]|nr:response regulator [Planctomycetaceae bacterium]
MPDPSFFNKSVLIVEDEDIIRETLAEFLTGEGFQVTTSSNVTEALKLARERDFDVGICDVQLPDGDGVQLLRRFHRINPAMFVLIISAYATVENAVEAFTAGAFDYLVKPV